jgi:hypothetical protein
MKIHRRFKCELKHLILVSAKGVPDADVIAI